MFLKNMNFLEYDCIQIESFSYIFSATDFSFQPPAPAPEQNSPPGKEMNASQQDHNGNRYELQATSPDEKPQVTLRDRKGSGDNNSNGGNAANNNNSNTTSLPGKSPTGYIHSNSSQHHSSTKQSDQHRLTHKEVRFLMGNRSCFII